jgi:hypothetical protein
MRINTNDLTLQRNYLQKYQFLIKEYELVKQKKHPEFTFVKDFYLHHHTCAQSFLKYYGRYNQNKDIQAVLPQKRGPRYRTRRPLPFIEEKVKALREKGNNRYEIVDILKVSLKKHTPSPSGVYNICKRMGINRLTSPMKQNKRKIIKEKAGELGHVDCHYLNRDIITGQHVKLFLVCIVDDYSRIAWAELVEDVKSISVAFATLKCLNFLTSEYQIRFEEILTDNGPEFGTKESAKKLHHPFERLLLELGITHRYTKPYRPQTNGKVERFWRTIEEDMLRDTSYESKEELKEELLNYLVYYNTVRPHQGINGKTPASQVTNSSTNY